MKTTILTAVAALIFAVGVMAEPVWESIENNVCTNELGGFEHHTDFVLDRDLTDNSLYVRFFRSGSPEKQAIWRLPNNMRLEKTPTFWQHIITFKANKEGEAFIATAKKNNNFIINVWSQGDWSHHSFWLTNKNGQIVVQNPAMDREAPLWFDVGNSHPSHDVRTCDFLSYENPSNYLAVCSQGTEANPDALIRKINENRTKETPYTKDFSTFKKANRAIIVGTNAYFITNPNNTVANDGIWVAPGITHNFTTALDNAYCIFPFANMSANGGNWNGTPDYRPVAIHYVKPEDNYKNKDLLIVTFRTDDDNNQIIAFDLNNPPGPEAMFGVTNMWRAGHSDWRGQVGHVGRYLYMINDSNPGDRDLYRLDLMNDNSTPPYIDITAGNQAVAGNVTTFAVPGSNSSERVGDLVWENLSTGQSGSTNIANETWEVVVPLAMGENLIYIRGTNSTGRGDLDQIVITRETPGEGTPSVSIGNGNAQLFVPASTYGLNGTANANVMGGMWWSNTTSGVGGSFAAAASWNATVTGLITGPNDIVVYGTNLLNAQASATTKLHVGYDYQVSFDGIGLPPDIGSRGRQASLGSNGTNIYLCLCKSGEPIFWLPWTATTSNEWARGAVFPNLANDNETGDGFGYYDGYLYTFAQLSGGWRDVTRYSIGANSWENGYATDNGLNSSCILDDQGYIYGGWRGAPDAEKQENTFPTTTRIWRASPGGGANHAWGTTRSDSKIYFLKGWQDNPGRIYSIPADGTSDGTFTFVTETPWRLGVGASISYVPASFSRFGRPELWVLRGAGGAGMNWDGTGGAPTPDLAIYDVQQGIWTRYTLDQDYGEGGGIKFVNGWMYLMAGGGDAVPEDFARTQTIPEPGLLAGGALVLLMLYRRGR